MQTGSAGIRACKLSIGQEEYLFLRSPQGADTVLTVDGNPANTPIHRFLPYSEDSMLLRMIGPADQPVYNHEFTLHYYLSYEVPRELLQTDSLRIA